MKNFKVKINSIETFATHDGDGIRVAVFLQGCPLRCQICHNPDTFDALQGEEIATEALFSKLIRYKSYFKNGGGITFSGGEPLLQSESLIELIKLLKNENINVAIDSSLAICNENAKIALKMADFIIADLKFYNKNQYIKYTGRDVFDVVLKNLGFLSDNDKKIILRTVVIPNINDSEENILEYIKVAKQFSIFKYELKPFHTMGFSKYERLGIENKMANKSALNEEKLQKLQNFLNKKWKENE